MITYEKEIYLFSIFLIILLQFFISFIFTTHVNAEDSNVSSYQVKQITSETEISSDSANEYIIVYEDEGNNYALASTIKTDSPKLAMDTTNIEIVSINSSTLTYTGNVNIFWTFTKSARTIEDSENTIVIASVTTLFSGDDETKKQIDFEEPNSVRDPNGIKYSTNAYGFTFHFQSDGTIILEQQNNRDDCRYLTFNSKDKRFLSGELEDAAKIKIYEIIKKYPIKSSFDITSIESTPQYPNAGSVKADKTSEATANYESTRLFNVSLSVTAMPIVKDVDVVLILDDSNSVYENIEGSENRKIDYIRKNC